MEGFHVAPAAGGGVSNPATSDLDMGTNDITNCGDIECGNIAAANVGTVGVPVTSVTADGSITSVEGQGSFSGTTVGDTGLSIVGICGISLGSNITTVVGINPVDGGAGVQIEGYSTGKVGFFGKAPVARITAASVATLADLKTYLTNLGLLS